MSILNYITLPQLKKVIAGVAQRFKVVEETLDEETKNIRSDVDYKINNVTSQITTVESDVDDIKNGIFPDGKLISVGTGTEAEIFNGKTEISSNIASGDYSHAEGYGTTTSGKYSHAEGRNTISSGYYSHAEGGGWRVGSVGSFYVRLKKRDNPSNAYELIQDETDTSLYCLSNRDLKSLSLLGCRIRKTSTLNPEVVTVMREYRDPSSTALSYITVTNPLTTTTEVTTYYLEAFNIAYGDSSHVEGLDNIAYGDYSHAEGSGTTASSTSSHAEGKNTTASGTYSHVEGLNNMASGEYSHAEGRDTIASGQTSHVEGYNTESSGTYSHAEGFGTTASGYSSHAEGKNTTASGTASHAEGESTTASGEHSHTEGYSTTASEGYSHAEGYQATASGEYSHAEGYHTTASRTSSHAEGYNTTASGYYSHSEGYHTTASGYTSHAEGDNTIAQRRSQHVFGEYNTIDTVGTNVSSKGQYIEMVGNGASDVNRSNARTLDWSGNEVLAGKLTVGVAPTNNMDVATKQYVDTATSGITSNLSGLTDTTITTPSDGQILTYDSTNSKWINSNIPDDTFIVTITSATSADKTYDQIVAAYNAGKKCVAVYGTTSAVRFNLHRITSSLVEFSGVASTHNYYRVLIYKSGTVSYGSESFLSPISITSPANGQILVYNSTTSKWENNNVPKEIMIVTFSQDQNEDWSADKTLSQISTHLSNGGLVYGCISDSGAYTYLSLTYYEIQAEEFYFYRAEADDTSFGYFSIIYGSEGITYEEEYGDASVSGLYDTTISSPSNGQVLTYNGTSSKWENSAIPSDSTKANVSDILTKTNTTSYTPTANYHPATKKYVDDAVSEDTFIVTITSTTSNGTTTYSADKTYSQIDTAFTAGKRCIAKQSSSLYELMGVNSVWAYFIQIVGTTSTNVGCRTITINSSNVVNLIHNNLYPKVVMDSFLERIAPINFNASSDDKAGQSYSSGDWFWKSNSTEPYRVLCKATASITSGATLTENTNYVTTTIEDEIKSCSNSALSLAMSGNTIQLKQSDTVISSVTLPVYNGGVSS